MVDPALSEIVWRAVSALMTGGLEADAIFARSRVTREDFQRTLDEYGRTFVVPPRDAYVQIDAGRIDDEPNSWFLWADLWSMEEGRSDLVVEMTVTIEADQQLVYLEDCRVP